MGEARRHRHIVRREQSRLKLNPLGDDARSRPSRTTPKIGGCTHDRGERLLAGLHILHDETDAVEGVELRSEEHTSELQSLMRISYAVFCLKNKQKHQKIKTDNTIYTITKDKNANEKYNTH